MADGDPIIIRQLQLPFTTLVLSGTSLPNQGVEIGGDLQLRSTMYPGAKAASVQVLGIEERPIAFEGMFDDQLVGFTGEALTKSQTLRDMWLGQIYCELSWGSTFVKKGYIQSYSSSFIRQAQIGYKFEFKVVESNEATFISVPSPIITPVFTRSILDILDDALQVAEDAALLLNLVQTVV